MSEEKQIENAEDLISIIVPVYNVAEYLQKCIESILDQEYKNFELILVNDGSTDSSFTICEKFASKEARIIIHNQENKGVSAARNVGLTLAKGKYICFVDSDDYIDPRYLSIMYRNLMSTDADISICSWTNYLVTKYRDNKDVSKWNAEEALIQYIKMRSIDGNICSKLYKKEILRQIRFDENMRLGEDQIFVIQAIERSTLIAFQNLPLYFYCIREDSAMRSNVDARYWDSVYRAEWLVNHAKVEYPNLQGLYRKEELNIYTILTIMNIKANTTDSNEIAKYVYIRLKKSKLCEFKNYSNKYEFIRYFIIKYFALVAKVFVKAKKYLKKTKRNI